MTDLPTSLLSDAERAQLMRLVYEAFDLRDSPYLHDACVAIVGFWESTRPDRLERRATAGTSLSREELARRLRR